MAAGRSLRLNRAVRLPNGGFALLELAVAMTLASVALTGLSATAHALTVRAGQALDIWLLRSTERGQAEAMDGCALAGACSLLSEQSGRLIGAPVGCLWWPDGEDTGTPLVIAGCR